MLLLRQHIRLFSILTMVLRVFLGNLPMLLFLIWLRQEPLLLTVPLALVLVIIGCLVTRTLSLKDVHLVRHILSGKRKKGTDDEEASEDIADLPTAILVQMPDIANWPTAIMPSIYK
jgi:hypothetical protein